MKDSVRSRLESDDGQAIRLLNEQLTELETVRGLSPRDPQFKAWRAQTRSYLERFLPHGSPHLSTFPSDFHRIAPATGAPWGSPKATRQRELDQEHFLASCETAKATIKAAVKHIEEFGVHFQQPASQPKGAAQGGVLQNFYGSVTIQHQAIATDNAIQKIDHMGDTTGASLKEVSLLLQQSEELKLREVREGLAGIEGLAVEVRKPEAKRNWKSILNYGQVILAVADKATDVAHKLAPYLPAVADLVHNAKLALGA
jgi:hypothetical protein